MTIYIGIDPGFSGAVAFLCSRTFLLAVHDMPVAANTKGKTEINLHALFDMLAPEDDATPGVAYIEQVAAMRGQGVSSMFRFGQGYGATQMAIVGNGHAMMPVTPQRWKKHFGLTSDKGGSRLLASQRFPNNADQFRRVKDDGRAEAALIALYGLETSR
jgi:crossover junction endodeoxyribonuclease RuvC